MRVQIPQLIILTSKNSIKISVCIIVCMMHKIENVWCEDTELTINKKNHRESHDELRGT